MSRSSLESIFDRTAKTVVYMTTGGLEHLIDKEGGVCKGFSLRSSSVDSLLVIRAQFGSVAKVAFVGGTTGAGCIYKAHKKLRNGGLQWREDKYAKPG